jgi:hypothetical protein
LENNPKIKNFLTDLLKKYSEKFAQDKNIDTSQLPLKFEGFHYNQKLGKGEGEMGYCFVEGKIANISLNRVYLLNKLGIERYFVNNPGISGDCLNISFSGMLETCSHEIAHYIQQVKYGISSCEGDLISENGDYDEELAGEHKE